MNGPDFWFNLSKHVPGTCRDGYLVVQEERDDMVEMYMTGYDWITISSLTGRRSDFCQVIVEQEIARLQKRLLR